MAEVQTDSTRVFVKGLPPAFTSDQLATHFRSQYRVTDAHVFPERRIGFVGFHDHDSAQNAVKHFNRSYIRMSKISVDLARPVEVRRDASGQGVPVSKRSAVHPTRARIETDQKSQESKESISNKRKRDTRDDGEVDRAGQAETLPSSDGTEQRKKLDDKHEQKDEELDVATSKSDNDWLRGKTSRLLDLVEPEETERSNAVPDVDMTDQKAASQDLPTEEDGARAEEDQAGANQSIPNARLFIRNLAFDITDADLEDRFSQFGKLQEAHVVKDSRKATSKGLAFIQFSEPEAAETALKCLDGVSFHGRLLHVLPASDKRDQGLTDYDISKMPLKKQKAIKRKMSAATATFSWNSLYMNPDAVLSSIADRLGVSKSEILEPTSSDAAVKQAHAETQLIAETKEFLRTHGVSIDAFETKQRDDRTLLLKNFPYGTSEKDLRDLLEPLGQISRLILPPAGTIALVQFVEPSAASQALRQLAYKNIKGSVLYLEKAPKGLLDESLGQVATVSQGVGVNENNDDREVATDGATATATLFVRNLNFATTTARLTETFGPLPGFMSARVKTRVEPKRPGEILSMGFGFVEFSSKASANAALSTLNGYRLDGHELIVQHSNKATDLAEERRKDDNLKKSEANRTKIIIKNLPFEVSRKDVRSLFAQYGQLKTIRVPKKFDSSSRGFGFAEFVTAKEAKNAMDALSSTHLLGRRLVLEFATEEEIDPEEQIQAMERKMEQQSNRIQLSKLTGSERKKFVIGLEDEV